MGKDKKTESKFTLIAGNRSFELAPYQSPRGLRNEDKRPTVIIIEVKEKFNLVELEKHIKFLVTLSCAMESE